jgi:uncharacterized Zn-finger protein
MRYRYRFAICCSEFQNAISGDEQASIPPVITGDMIGCVYKSPPKFKPEVYVGGIKGAKFCPFCGEKIDIWLTD